VITDVQITLQQDVRNQGAIEPVDESLACGHSRESSVEPALFSLEGKQIQFRFMSTKYRSTKWEIR
jgi:hypothetical protein